MSGPHPQTRAHSSWRSIRRSGRVGWQPRLPWQRFSGRVVPGAGTSLGGPGAPPARQTTPCHRGACVPQDHGVGRAQHHGSYLLLHALCGHQQLPERAARDRGAARGHVQVSWGCCQCAAERRRAFAPHMCWGCCQCAAERRSTFAPHMCSAALPLSDTKLLWGRGQHWARRQRRCLKGRLGHDALCVLTWPALCPLRRERAAGTYGVMPFSLAQVSMAWQCLDSGECVTVASINPSCHACCMPLAYMHVYTPPP